MSESGVEFLDEIGLVLNIFVLLFVVLFTSFRSSRGRASSGGWMRNSLP